MFHNLLATYSPVDDAVDCSESDYQNDADHPERDVKSTRSNINDCTIIAKIVFDIS